MATRYSLDDEKPPYFANIKDARKRCIEDDIWPEEEAGRNIYADGKEYACVAKMDRVIDGTAVDILLEKANTPYVYWVWDDDDVSPADLRYYPVYEDGSTKKPVDLRTNADGTICLELMNAYAGQKFKELYAAFTDEDDNTISMNKYFMDLSDLRRWSRDRILQKKWVLNNPDIKAFMGIPAVVATNIDMSLVYEPEEEPKKELKKKRRTKKKDRTIPIEALIPVGLVMRCSETDAIWGAGDKWNIINKDGSLGKKYAYPGRGPTLDDLIDVQLEGIRTLIPNNVKETSDGKMMSKEEAERKSARKKQMREELAADEAKVKALSEQSLRRLKKKYSAEAIHNAAVALGFDVVDSSYTLLMTGEAPIQDSLEEFIQRLEDRVAEEQRKIDERDGNVKKEKKGTVEKMKGLVNDAMELMKPAEETEVQLTADAIGDTIYNMNELAHLYFKAMELQDTLVERCVKMTLTAEEIKKLDDACETIVTIVGEKYDAMFSETVQALAEQCNRRE